MSSHNPHQSKPAARRKRVTKNSSQALSLSRELIVDTALELVNEVGLTTFSTRLLGQQLGCEAMSIYHHFKSKQHLLDAMVEHAISSVEVAELKPGMDVIAALRRCIYSYRAMARRWPALFPLVATHRLNTPTGVRFIESVLTLFNAVSPNAEITAQRFRAIGYYLNGAGLDETAGYARGPSAAEPVSDEFIQGECPILVSVAPYFKEGHWDATFDYGIEALMKELTEEQLKAKE